MQGDALARGAKSAQFGGPKVSQEKWDAIFGPKEKKKPKLKWPCGHEMYPEFDFCRECMVAPLKKQHTGPLLKTSKK